jgi:hypothetical protein
MIIPRPNERNAFQSTEIETTLLIPNHILMLITTKQKIPVKPNKSMAHPFNLNQGPVISMKPGSQGTNLNLHLPY